MHGPDFYTDMTEYNKFQNNGDCNHAIWYIIGYTLSLFIVQYNIGSIMHHRFVHFVQYIYSIMVPLTFLAFLAAMPVLSSSGVKTDYTTYDVVGLIIVAAGVFLFNFIPEKPQQVCIIENDGANAAK